MTIASATAASATTAADSAAASGRVPKKTMGQEDFLKLITVQLAKQDPMKPMEDTDFMAQMAQFTSLEQSSQMAREMVNLRADLAQQSAVGMIGRQVVIEKDGAEITGVVEGVDRSGGQARVTVGGAPYLLSQVVSVAPVATPAS